MSSLGQLAGRIDRNLKRVSELTKALIALRAQLLGKTDVLRLTPAAIGQAGQTVAVFLDGLVPVLDTGADGAEEHKFIRQRLIDGGQQPADWAADFRDMASALRANTPLRLEQLDKISEVVGYLQGEVAEDVRRLRSR